MDAQNRSIRHSSSDCAACETRQKCLKCVLIAPDSIPDVVLPQKVRDSRFVVRIQGSRLSVCFREWEPGIVGHSRRVPITQG
jgi:hypothetical protein